MDQAAQNFVRTFLVVSGVLLAAMALVNRVVDPFGAYPGFPSDVFRDTRGGHPDQQDSRVAKAELVRQFTGTTVLVGSSRVRAGYDPESPAIPDGPACNLGLGGTNFYELAQLLDFTLQQPHVRRIVLCLDFHLFLEGRTVSHDFEVSRFNPQLSAFDYHCNLLVRKDATRDSLHTLRRYFRGGRSKLTRLGFRRPDPLKLDVPAARLAERSVRSSLHKRDTLAGGRYSQQRLDALAQVVRACRAADVELIVLIQPLHATKLEELRCVGQWETRERWTQDVVRIVADASAGRTPVWDFTAFGRYTTEPLLTSPAPDLRANRWFWEPSHCKAELGELVLRRIFAHSDADPTFGRPLTPDLVPKHLAQIRQEHTAWTRTHAEEVRRVTQLAQNAGYDVANAVATRFDTASRR